MSGISHGWTQHGQERGAMVLKPTAPQAKLMAMEAQNRVLEETNKALADQLGAITAALQAKGIMPADETGVAGKDAASGASTRRSHKKTSPEA